VLDSLLSVSDQLDREVAVQTEGETDMVVTINGTVGAEQVTFVVQVVGETGRVLASARVNQELSPAISDALESAETFAADGDDRDDVPDSSNRAREIEVDSTAGDVELRRSGDNDWFVVTIPEVPRGLDGVPGLDVYTTGPTDTYIEIYGPDDSGERLTENDDDEGTNAGVVFPVETGQRYWMMVRGFADSATGPYTLHVESTVLTADPGEPNDRRSEASPLPVEDLPVTAAIRPSGDVDWYVVDLAEIQLDTPAEGDNEETVIAIATTGDLDTVMTAYDQAGEEIANNDDGGSGTNARLTLSPDAGEVFIEVRGFGDWVQGEYQITVDTDLLVYDENRNEIMSNDDGGAGFNARITTQLDPGTYFVEVTPLYLDATNPEYELEARRRE
jgi:hypothetical protein